MATESGLSLPFLLPVCCIYAARLLPFCCLPAASVDIAWRCLVGLGLAWLGFAWPYVWMDFACMEMFGWTSLGLARLGLLGHAAWLDLAGLRLTWLGHAAIIFSHKNEDVIDALY